MSTTEALSTSELSYDDDAQYRAINAGAVASAVFGALSALVCIGAAYSIESALMMALVPALGIILGILALRRISANPDQYTGAGAAKVGIALSAFFLVAGIAYAGYVHATEVPAGYTRTSFAEFKPDEVDLRGDHPVPPAVAALDGQKVFIKGYMRPGTHYSDGGSAVNQHIKRFLLVRDNYQCCFGDLSSVKYFDQMAVRLTGPLTVDYTTGLYRMAGTLHITPRNIGGGGPVFELEADHAE
jgi:hypothetical protein